MKLTFQALIVTIIFSFASAVGVFLFGLFGECLTQSNGIVRVSASVSINQQFFSTVDVIVFNNQQLDGLIVNVPNSLIYSEIAASRPIQIERVPDSLGTNANARIKLSGFEPHVLTRLLIPFRTNSTPQAISITNKREKSLDVEYADSIDNPRIVLAEKAAVYSVVDGVFIFIACLWFEKRWRDLKAESLEIHKTADSLLEKAEKQGERIEAIKNESRIERDNQRNTALRIKIVLLARLKDTSRELEFWRDTVRRILISIPDGEKRAEKVIAEITNTLKTYAAQAREPDFDTLEVYAAMLSKHSAQRVDDEKRHSKT
jgi:hypothetical protein